MNAFFFILFLISLLFLLYIYIGYPIIIFLLSCFKAKGRKWIQNNYVPFVTLIIPARNEEKIIEKKIRNCQTLDYPKSKLEIIILSDQSTDRTNEIIKRNIGKQFQIIELQTRHGKTAVQNIAAQKASGEILVFSDANAMYNADAIQKLIAPFQDKNIGCVCGELCYNNSSGNAVGKEEGLYWDYEKFIKRSENRFFSIVGANGSIYAIRKLDYVPLEYDVISDFIEPLEIVRRGKKVVYESTAISVEESSISFQEELKRKRRIISRSLYSLTKHTNLLNPIHSFPLFFELVSHKLLRWMSPIFQILLFSSNLFLIKEGFFFGIFLGQCLFYGMSLMGWIFRNISALPSVLFAPFYFNVINYASLLGISDWLRKKHAVTWEPLR